jgi:hypothetical protein
MSILLFVVGVVIVTAVTILQPIVFFYAKLFYTRRQDSWLVKTIVSIDEEKNKCIRFQCNLTHVFAMTVCALGKEIPVEPGKYITVSDTKDFIGLRGDKRDVTKALVIKDLLSEIPTYDRLEIVVFSSKDGARLASMSIPFDQLVESTIEGYTLKLS